ncbi:MAG: PPC domain-containing protein [Planctomycetia bacterium]|nr:PPC domain-containing protein [Planctomycetia bacterium]
MSALRRIAFAIAAALLLPPAAAFAQPQAPLYEECRLDTIFPAGGRRGTSVKVEMHGFKGGLASPRELIIDGPPGLAVRDLKSVNGSTVEATLDIAPDAPPGRRWVRLLNERSGLTNFAYFVVGRLPEQLETEPNNEIAKAEAVTAPVVINGRINPAADLDVFRFAGKKGQRVVAAIAAHALDIHGQGRNYGIADFSLELLDAEGRTLASAEDTVGFDPLIEHELPRDGEYFVRVQLLNYQGFPEAVYRLTLGEAAYPTAAFPPGLARENPGTVELFGLHVAPGTKGSAGVAGAAWDPAYTLRHVALDRDDSSGLDVPVLVGEFTESTETEPNDDRAQAGVLAIESTVNGRFQTAEDVDWYRVRLDAQQKVQFEIVAQRWLRSPVDTLLQVYDAQGKMLAENDDEAFDPGYESYHDFKSTDSRLEFTAPAAGEYFVKVKDQSGVHGPRAVYRLTLKPGSPDFRLTHFPDAVPVWGPGSTACVLVRIDRFGGCNDDIEVAVEGLPEGWSSSAATSLATTPERPFVTYQFKVFVTITAPAGAAVGTAVPFRVVGRSKRTDGNSLERRSLPLTLYYTSDTGFFRASPLSRVAVAKAQGPWLEAVTKEITIAAGGTGTIAVRVHGDADLKTMPIVVNLATFGVACGLTTPQNLPINNGLVEVPLKVPPEMHPGTYGITVAQTWRSDIRIGMPGPCTPLIKLTVEKAK